jgi:hypothetical protein
LQIRAAIRDISKYTSSGFTIPGTAGARINASARASVAMERQIDGSYLYAPHNLLTNSQAATGASAADCVDNGIIAVAPRTGAAAGTQVRSVTLGAGGGAVWRLGSTSTGVTGASVSGGVWVRAASGTPTLIFDCCDGSALAVALSTEWVYVTRDRPVTPDTWAFFDITNTSGVAITVYICEPRVCFGLDASVYIPTTTTAIYAPAISYDSAISNWRTQSEAASTNWLLWNTKYANAAWTKSNCTATDDATTAPDGTTTACTLTATGANATCKQGVSTTAVLWTFSVFLRRKTGTGNVDITMDGSTWVTQTISAGAWTRCIVTQTGVAGTSNPGIRLVTSGDEVWVWAAQAE